MGAWGHPGHQHPDPAHLGCHRDLGPLGAEGRQSEEAGAGSGGDHRPGLSFRALQAWEYRHAYHELNLTLESGVYGSTFYMLTGFHGFPRDHGRGHAHGDTWPGDEGHFSPHNHFAFEAVAWYWHFVDVVWLGLFVFVYWL